MIQKPRAFLPPEVVLTRFAAETGIPMAELVGPASTRDIMWQRSCAMYALRHLTSATMAQIGAMFERDRKVAEIGVDRVAQRLADEPDYRAMMQRLLAAIAPVAPTEPVTQPGVSLERLMAAAVLRDPLICAEDAIPAAITLLRPEGGTATPKGF